MTIVERGSGEPIVVIPGVQGRWEYVGAAVDALARSHRVITFSLCDEPSARSASETSAGVEAFAVQVDAALAASGVERAAICGISFGGLIALHFAARRPERTSALIMVSAPGPGWHLKRRHEVYARVPWLFGPIFAAESPFRLWREIAVALPDPRERRRFVRSQVRTLAESPVSLSRMAARARAITAFDRRADCAAIGCPTLIVHGDPALDHVVDANGTSEYAHLIRGAVESTLERTGHLGSVTRPVEFADVVGRFLANARQGHHDSAA